MVNLPLWQAYVEKVCGFVLPSVQRNWLMHAITSTAHQQQMDVDELYVALIEEQGKSGEYLPALTQALLDNLLIAESRFFRHEPSMAFIGEVYKTAINEQRKLKDQGKLNLEEQPQKFSVWSVGCSTGQEVYSLAMTLTLIFRQLASPIPFIINGSDLSMRSLAVAKNGEYLGRQIDEIPARYRPQTRPLTDEVSVFKHQKMWQIDEKTRQRTHFFWHNIFTKLPTDLPKQQIIICQNVLIYFRRFDQRDILAYFVQNLAVGGYLLFAPNEAMFWQHPKMKRVENGQVNAWQKISE